MDKPDLESPQEKKNLLFLLDSSEIKGGADWDL